MIREAFQELAEATINEGFAKGIELFIESLDEQLGADPLYEGEGEDEIIKKQLLEFIGEEEITEETQTETKVEETSETKVEETSDDEVLNLDQIDEEVLDKMIDQLKNE